MRGFCSYRNTFFRQGYLSFSRTHGGRMDRNLSYDSSLFAVQTALPQGTRHLLVSYEAFHVADRESGNFQMTRHANRFAVLVMWNKYLPFMATCYCGNHVLNTLNVLNFRRPKKLPIRDALLIYLSVSNRQKHVHTTSALVRQYARRSMSRER